MGRGWILVPLIQSLNGKTPCLGRDVFLASGVKLVGDIEIGEKSSIWFNSVLRGDVYKIRIGNETNVQDGSIIHGTFGRCGTSLGNCVTIGHGVILHGCTVDSESLIGMGSIIMDEVHIRSHSIVGAGSLVTQNQKFDEGVLIMGRPAKVIRKLNAKELSFLKQSADNYVNYTKWYKDEGLK